MAFNWKKYCWARAVPLLIATLVFTSHASTPLPNTTAAKDVSVNTTDADEYNRAENDSKISVNIRHDLNYNALSIDLVDDTSSMGDKSVESNGNSAVPIAAFFGVLVTVFISGGCLAMVVSWYHRRRVSDVEKKCDGEGGLSAETQESAVAIHQQAEIPLAQPLAYEGNRPLHIHHQRSRPGDVWIGLE